MTVLSLERAIYEGIIEGKRGRGRPRRRWSQDITDCLNTTMTETGEQSVGFKSLRTPDIQQLLNVPWDVPKLKKKLQNRNFCFRGQPSSPELSPRRYRMQLNH